MEVRNELTILCALNDGECVRNQTLQMLQHSKAAQQGHPIAQLHRGCCSILALPQRAVGESGVR